MLLRAEEQDRTYPRINQPFLFISKAHMACQSHSHEISGQRHNNLPVCPIKDSRFWSHMSKRTAEGKKL